MWTSCISWLEDASGVLLPILQKQVVFSTILFAIVLALTTILRKQSPLLHLGLWMLVLIRLVLPTDLSLPVSARNLFDHLKGSLKRPTAQSVLPGTSNQGISSKISMSDPIDDSSVIPAGLVREGITTRRLIPWKSVLFGGWMTGVFILLTVYLKRLLDYQRLVRKAKNVVKKERIESLEHWKSLYRIRRSVRLVTSDEYLSPFTIGIFRPVIYLPGAISETENVSLAEAVISHELAHVRCYDALWMKLQNLVQIAYFFHPVAWIMGSRIHLLRECICDSLVISKRKLSTETYGLGLLSVLKWNVFGTDEVSILPGFGSPRKKVMHRILNIKRHTDIGKFRLALIIGVLVVLAVFILPMAASPGRSKIVKTGMEFSSYSSIEPEWPMLASVGPRSDDSSSVKPIGEENAPEFINPVQNGTVTSPFGKRKDPISEEVVNHRGVDIRCPKGTPVYAMADGTVLIAENRYVKGKGEGRHIFINHSKGFQTRYTQLDTVLVKEGQKVNRWEMIGKVGNSGRSTGPHLHYEVIQEGTPIDPQKYFPPTEKQSPEDGRVDKATSDILIHQLQEQIGELTLQKTAYEAQLASSGMPGTIDAKLVALKAQIDGLRKQWFKEIQNGGYPKDRMADSLSETICATLLRNLAKETLDRGSHENQLIRMGMKPSESLEQKQMVGRIDGMITALRRELKGRGGASARIIMKRLAPEIMRECQERLGELVPVKAAYISQLKCTGSSQEDDAKFGYLESTITRLKGTMEEDLEFLPDGKNLNVNSLIAQAVVPALQKEAAKLIIDIASYKGQLEVMKYGEANDEKLKSMQASLTGIQDEMVRQKQVLTK